MMKPPGCLRPAAALLTIAASLITPAGGQFAVQGPRLGLNGVVHAVESQADGRVFLGGSFRSFNGTSATGLIRLLGDGTRDGTLDIAAVGAVRDLLVTGNFLYVGGEFEAVQTRTAGAFWQPFLFRIHLAGAKEGKVDTTWVPAVDGPVEHFETDGSDLFLAGDFRTVNGAARTRLAKIRISEPADPDAVDPAWNPGADGKVEDLEVNGSWLYVCGYFSSIAGIHRDYLARVSLTGTGAADTQWTPETNRPVSTLESDAGHVYTGGRFESANGYARRSLVRFSAAAGEDVLDTSWYPDLDGEPSALLLAGSSLYASGVFMNAGSTPRFFMAKLSTGGGTVDGTFIPNPNGAVLDMKMVGGAVLAGGRFTTTVGASCGGFALMDAATGAASASFAGTITTTGLTSCLIPLAGGGMMIGGTFDTVNGVLRPGLARLNPDGSVDESLDAQLFGYSPTVYDMKVDGTMLYIAGNFQRAAGGSREHVARVNLATGAVDTGWNPSAHTPLTCIETDASHVYVGSSAGLYSVNYTSVYNIARISKATGGTDAGWRPAVTMGGDPNTAWLEDMVFDGDRLIICGYFSHIVDLDDLDHPYPRMCLAELETAGPSSGLPTAGWDTQFLAGTPDNLEPAAVEHALLHNGSLYVSGDFLYAGGEYQYFVAKIDPDDGAYDNGFFVAFWEQDDPYTGDNVGTIAAAGDHIYVGGDYQEVWDGASGLDEWPYLVRVDQDSGAYDPSWYAWPDGPVSVMAFQGADLWIDGSYRSLLWQDFEDVVILRPNPAAYQAWLAAHLPAWQLQYADYTAPFWDDDHDGLSNLVEYAFNMNPRQTLRQVLTPGTGTTGMPAIRTELLGGQRHLVAEFVRRKASAAPGIDYAPLFGAALDGSWSDPAVEISITPINTELERVKVRNSTANLPRTFGTVKVSPTAP